MSEARLEEHIKMMAEIEGGHPEAFSSYVSVQWAAAASFESGMSVISWGFDCTSQFLNRAMVHGHPVMALMALSWSWDGPSVTHTFMIHTSMIHTAMNLNVRN